MKNWLVFSMPGNDALGNSLAETLRISEGSMILRQFPDGETYVRGETSCAGKGVILAASLHHPDPLILPLIFTVHALRELGAEQVVLAAPYLAYMRQDKQFNAGEVVTSRVFARLLSDTVDALVTIDPHLHRYRSLSEIYTIPTRVEHAAPGIAEWIRTHVEHPVLIGPDSESKQWVSEVAQMADAPYLVLSKIRHGDRSVEIEVPGLEPWREHTPVLVDDIISTGQTMLETISHLLTAGYAPPICVGVHGVFAGDAYVKLKQAGVKEIVTCNTIAHSSNRIDMVPALSSALREMLGE